MHTLNENLGVKKWPRKKCELGAKSKSSWNHHFAEAITLNMCLYDWKTIIWYQYHTNCKFHIKLPNKIWTFSWFYVNLDCKAAILFFVSMLRYLLKQEIRLWSAICWLCKIEIVAIFWNDICVKILCKKIILKLS